MWKRVQIWMENNEWWVLGAIGAILLRIPSLSEPYWYGDEGIYLTIGRALNMGVKLYSQIHDNKPPLLYLAAALAGGEQFWFRFEALVVNVLAVIVFAKLAEKVFSKTKSAKQTAMWVFVLLTNLPFWEGNIANAENFFLLATTFAVWCLWETKQTKKIFLGGLAIGIGGLFKVPAILEAGVWPLIWLRSGRGWWKKTIILGIGVLIPILISGGYYYTQGSILDYLKAAWMQNLPYLSSWKASGQQTGIFSLTTRAAFVIVLAATGIGLMKTLGKKGVTIGLWGIIALFAALLSGRPYPHYLLQLSGALSLAVGLLYEEEYKGKIVTGMITALLVVSWISFKFYVYPSASYYTNFLKWTWGRETKQEYWKHFGNSLEDLYMIARNIKANTNRNDKIFVWGDVPMVYALAERIPATKYMVEYHIKDFKGEKLTIDQINKNQPKIIVVADKTNILPELQAILSDKYYMEMKTDRFDVYKLGQL